MLAYLLDLSSHFRHVTQITWHWFYHFSQNKHLKHFYHFVCLSLSFVIIHCVSISMACNTILIYLGEFPHWMSRPQSTNSLRITNPYFIKTIQHSFFFFLILFIIKQIFCLLQKILSIPDSYIWTIIKTAYSKPNKIGMDKMLKW